jgi:hypothetical protein
MLFLMGTVKNSADPFYARAQEQKEHHEADNIQPIFSLFYSGSLVLVFCFSSTHAGTPFGCF